MYKRSVLYRVTRLWYIKYRPLFSRHANSKKSDTSVCSEKNNHTHTQQLDITVYSSPYPLDVLSFLIHNLGDRVSNDYPCLLCLLLRQAASHAHFQPRLKLPSSLPGRRIHRPWHALKPSDEHTVGQTLVQLLNNSLFCILVLGWKTHLIHHLLQQLLLACHVEPSMNHSFLFKH